MKRLLTAVIAFVLAVSMCPYTFATEQGTVVSYQEIDLGNGIVIIDQITEYANTRALGKTATRTRTIKANDTVIAIVTIQATFHYDGTTVSVVSKGVNQADTYEGWSYKQNSFTSSGGTVTLDAKLTKLFYQSIPFTITLSCDKDGNLS